MKVFTCISVPKALFGALFALLLSINLSAQTPVLMNRLYGNAQDNSLAPLKLYLNLVLI